MAGRRLVLVAIGAFFATGVSLDPRVRAPAVAAADPERASVADARALGEPTGPAPADLVAEVKADARGAFRVVVRRPGFFVSLRDESARAGGLDWTALRIAASARSGEIAGRLVWETTRLGDRELRIERGLVRLAGFGESLTTELLATAGPAPCGGWHSANATCWASHDGLGGFTALCRFASHVRVTGVANVTGARSLDDAWLVRERDPFVRLDLARTPGGAEGRVIGMMRGATGVLLTAEARFPEGEPSTLIFHEASRLQPTL